MITTISVAYRYWELGKENDMVWTLSILGFTLFAQAAAAFATGQGTIAILFSLIGAKPLFDTYNVMADEPFGKLGGCKISPVKS